MERNDLLTERNLFKWAFLPYTSVKNRKWEKVANNVWMYTNRIVNICLLENEHKELIMVDAGMPKDYKVIMQDIKSQFKGRIPAAIILTHGHFDHVGSLVNILAEWDIPVYASEKEIPYLTGTKDYPGERFSRKGLVALLSRSFPNEGINLGDKVVSLPENQTVPLLEEWVWMYTPGHTPGHISLYNRKMKVMIAGDAVVTVKQESLFAVLTQRYSLNGPPAYFTPDRKAARQSIIQLAQKPIRYLVTGHGPVIRGEGFIDAELRKLVKVYRAE
ncbi:MBL fold metallo-hydrolase [Bacillus sp. AGMB 02131]|uniref:MBL fold metallo-hydrolase n=1 Tax=Peribacillus faecalis TaxID=2772559 RepID=A0A927HA24_9BACI|nr:MBL fold metallo-hydrolase [Peribacillus faecalis]MBD3108200.1 MBL fold metallo-hydrolase [Peribacillus faecalis]